MHDGEAAVVSTSDSGPEEARRVVLIVEDEALLALELEDAVLRAGFAARISTGADVLDAIGGCDLVAAVVELKLAAATDGRSLIRRLRSVQPGLPVLVVTGYARSSAQADLRGLGGPTARLEKPVNLAELACKLRCVIGSHDGIGL